MPYFLFVWSVWFCLCLNRKGSKTEGMEGTGPVLPPGHRQSQERKIPEFLVGFCVFLADELKYMELEKSPAVIGRVCCYYSQPCLETIWISGFYSLIHLLLTTRCSNEQEGGEPGTLSLKERTVGFGGVSKCTIGSKEKGQVLLLRWKTIGWNFGLGKWELGGKLI